MRGPFSFRGEGGGQTVLRNGPNTIPPSAAKDEGAAGNLEPGPQVNRRSKFKRARAIIEKAPTTLA